MPLNSHQIDAIKRAERKRDTASKAAEIFLAEAKKWTDFIAGLNELYSEDNDNETSEVQMPTTNEGSADLDPSPFQPLVWDNAPNQFRRNLRETLRHIGRFAKVSELADIAAEYEEGSKVDLQEKISRNMTAMKKNFAEFGLVLVKVHAGSNGYAWGYKEWLDEAGNVKEERKYQLKTNEMNPTMPF